MLIISQLNGEYSGVCRKPKYTYYTEELPVITDISICPTGWDKQSHTVGLLLTAVIVQTICSLTPYTA